MRIGIDGSRAFLPERTGIEEYSYQVIKHLPKELDGIQVFLYLRRDQIVDFELPENWKIKIIKLPRLWTQVGLSLELFFHPVDVLFVPAHTLPIIHPKRSYVVVHGLEYEIMPEGYSFWERLYMRFSIERSCRWAKKIIAVSKNTKKDLMELYGVSEGKIEVVYEGVRRNSKIVNGNSEEENPNYKLQITNYKPYLMFIGRLEKRKNVEGIIEAFEILRDKYKIQHKLVLAGKAGFGYEDIKYDIENSRYRQDIIEAGFVSEEEKYKLMAEAEVFVFPTFYEGFGLPVLEAQSIGVPVVCSNSSSFPEVGGESVAYCRPEETKSVADAIYSILSDEDYKKCLIRAGFENVKRFSWESCAESIAGILLKK